MVEAIVTATEIQNNFGKYLNMVINGNQVIITKNGKEVGRIIPKDVSATYLTDTLTGVLRNTLPDTDSRAQRIKEHYELDD